MPLWWPRPTCALAPVTDTAGTFPHPSSGLATDLDTAIIGEYAWTWGKSGLCSCIATRTARSNTAHYRAAILVDHFGHFRSFFFFLIIWFDLIHSWPQDPVHNTASYPLHTSLVSKHRSGWQLRTSLCPPQRAFVKLQGKICPSKPSPAQVISVPAGSA